MFQLNAYLNFDGNCREAMQFYKDCFGGELHLQKVSESPEMASRMPPEMKDLILHSSLTHGGFMFMASDLHRKALMEGNTIHLCINCESEDQINRLFTCLSEEGTVIEPLGNVPWGAIYGEVTDKYKKHWLLNYMKNPQ